MHRAVSKGFSTRGYHLGHVTGHSIGMTMIELPKIGEGVDFELGENMVFSMHPHAIADTRRLPLHAGHVARHGRRRRAARDAADGALPQVAAREIAGEPSCSVTSVRGHRRCARSASAADSAVAGGAGLEDALVLALALADDLGLGVASSR